MTGKLWQPNMGYEPPEPDGWSWCMWPFWLHDRPDSGPHHRSVYLAFARRARPPDYHVTMTWTALEYEARLSRGTLSPILNDLARWGAIIRDSSGGRHSTRYRLRREPAFGVLLEAQTLPDLQRTPEVLATSNLNRSGDERLGSNRSGDELNSSGDERFTSLIEIETDPASTVQEMNGSGSTSTSHHMTGSDIDEPTPDPERVRQLIDATVAGTAFGDVIQQRRRDQKAI